MIMKEELNEKLINSSLKESPVMIDWNNINYHINDNKNTRTKSILTDIKGYAKPGEILAILGPSGCGKTTLLNILASRQLSSDKNHVITKNVNVNGIQLNSSNFGKICAYVMQDDILSENLTPKESITFAANIKLNIENAKKENRIKELIKQFGLEKCQNTRIGNVEQKGISGGERKRTSIAYEIVSDQQVIILDEPTTGMDSYTSLVIMKYLKKLALMGKTIICTIHQPSSDIFNLIDRIMLLKEGYVVYQDDSKYLLDYFKNINYIIPEYCNPFDFCLTLLQNESTSVIELHEQYLKSFDKLDKSITENQLIYKIDKNEEDSIYSSSPAWIFQLYYLLIRGVTNYFRNKTVFWARLFQYMFNTLVLFGFYYDIGAKDNLFFNYLGICFNSVNNLFINGLFTTLLMIPVIRKLLKREYASKMYSISAFYISLLIILLIPSFLTSIIYSPIMYFGIQMNKDFTGFIYFYLITFFTWTLGEFFGLLCGSFFGDQLSLIISPITFILFLLGSGFFRSNASFPSYLKWLNIISPYKYIMELYLKVQQNFNYITEILPEAMGYTTGVTESIIILSSTSLLVIILGFIGVRMFSSKF